MPNSTKEGCLGCLVTIGIIFIFSLIFSLCSDKSEQSGKKTDSGLSRECEKQCSFQHSVGTIEYENCVGACALGFGEGYTGLKKKYGIE